MRRGRVRSNKRKKGGMSLVLLVLFLLIAAGGAFFAYTSPLFEKQSPTIIANSTISANSKTPIKFKLSDNVALKSCKVILSSNAKEYTIYNQKFLIKSKTKDVEVPLPKEILSDKNGKWSVLISATDSSLWNFAMGNSAQFRAELIVDNTPPQIALIARSQKIRKGGSGDVIYRVDDKNLKQT
jgi:hypothetical protein